MTRLKPSGYNESSTILVYVYDQIRVPQSEVEKDLEKLRRDDLAILVIANMEDELAELNPVVSDVLEFKPAANHLSISAKYKEKIDKVKKSLYNLVNEGNISSESTVVSNLRHYQALSGAHDSLLSALNGLNMNLSGDLLAMDIRHSLRYLGEITGQVDVEDLLENIFSKFCIGK